MNISYFPAGSRSQASSRLRVHKIADALVAKGHHVTVAPYSYDVEDADVIVVQKRLDWVDEMAEWVKDGKRVIWDVDDWIKHPNLPEGVQVTVDTPYKLRLYPDAQVVPDALDIDSQVPFKVVHAPKLQRVVWVGNPENWEQMKHVIWACEKLKLDIIAITDTTSRHYAQYPNVIGVQWALSSVDAEIIQSDIMVCPYIFDGSWSAQWVNSKSANRLLKGWGLGMPMAGTPIPAYTEVGLQYAATTTDEWEHVFDTMSHKEAREYDAERGYKIAQLFRADKVADRWLEVFNG